MLFTLKLNIQKTNIMASGPITSNRWEKKNGNSGRIYFLGLQNHLDSDCSHEINRYLFLGKNTMANLDNVLKGRASTLPKLVCIVKAVLFPVVMYKCESWTIKKAEHQRIDGFESWHWRRLLRVPWTARRSYQ